MTSTDRAASSGRLIQLCVGYFAFYVLTSVLVKYFLKFHYPDFKPEDFAGIHFLTNSTLGANAIVLLVILLFRWIKLKSNRMVSLGPLKVPSELAYIIPSGICTGVIIPATTLMYTLPISVMVAMVIMRGSVIVVSRLVDAVQIWQGILTKTVYWEENVGVVLAVLAVATNVVGVPGGEFAFFADVSAMVVFCAYVVA
jgi:hypothetical protein